MASCPAVERDRFVAFAFAAADVLIETEPDGRIVYATGATGRLVPGGGDGLLTGAACCDLVAPADRVLLRLLFDEVAAGGRRGPVTVAGADGAWHAECSVLRMPGSRNFHLAFRRLAQAGRMLGDRETGLLDADAFGEVAQQKLVELLETDQALELSLVRIAGLDTVPGGVDGPQGRDLIRRLAAALRAVSQVGNGAGRVGADRFAFLHTGDDEVGRLDRLLEEPLAEAGMEQVRLERHDVRLDDAGLTPSQACAALRHAIERFGEEGSVDFDRLADALGQKLADTAARIAAAKAVIDSRAFYVMYQPIVGLADGSVHHHEALARLRDHGSSVFEFVTFAETIGFITDFDLAVTREVYDKLATLRRRRQYPQIAVNLSARSLASDGFVDRLVHLAGSAGDNATQVLFEITESFQLTDLERANHVIQRLRSLGHGVCLDDFGAGSAAFHYIRALQVDYVKLDGAFVQRVLEGERDRAILAGMVELCRSLKVATVAEMVETAAQAEGLRAMGVDYAQGFLFGRAVSDPMAALDRHAVAGV